MSNNLDEARLEKFTVSVERIMYRNAFVKVCFPKTHTAETDTCW